VRICRYAPADLLWCVRRVNETMMRGRAASTSTGVPVHAATAPIGRPTCSILGCCSFCQVITDRSQIIKISMLFLRCSTAIDDVFFRRSLVLPNWLPNDFRKLLLHPPVTKLLRAHGEVRVLNKSLRYTGPDGGQTDRQEKPFWAALYGLFLGIVQRTLHLKLWPSCV
jgi:hypothetical protein